MKLKRIPVFDAPFQRMIILLNGRSCTFTLRYNKTVDRWVFDIGVDTTVTLVHGRRIVVGVDLISIYPYLDLGSIIALDYFSKGALPGYNELVEGRVRLYHIGVEERNLLGAELVELNNASV